MLLQIFVSTNGVLYFCRLQDAPECKSEPKLKREKFKGKTCYSYIIRFMCMLGIIFQGKEMIRYRKCFI